MRGSKKQYQSISYLKDMKDIRNPDDYKLSKFEIYWSGNYALIERELTKRESNSELVKYLSSIWNIFRVGPRGGITELH